MIDVNIPRFNQACVAILTALAFVTNSVWLVVIVAAALAATRFLGRRYALFTQLYLRAVAPRLDGTPDTEPAGPPRFAQLVGTVFLVGASVALLAGWTAIGWALALIVASLAALAALTRICVGCIIYERALGR